MNRTMAVLTLAALSACAANTPPGPPMPTHLEPVAAEQVGQWVAATVRQEAGTRVRFHWNFLKEQGNASGRGSAWMVPPDTLRLDFRGPLGSGSSAAAVVGAREVWAVPEEDVRKLVPSFPILWAMLGRALAPDPGAALTGYTDESVTAWRAVLGVDTVDYVVAHRGKDQLVADVRLDGAALGRVVTTFDSEGRLATARLDIPSGPARLELSFYDHRPAGSIPDSLWQRPADDQ